VLSLHTQRGQTIPVWAFGTLTLIALLAFAVNYGNALYWQLRAQNAADSVAQGLLSIQATRWNAMIADLHAATVEEYRLRYLARDIAVMSSYNPSIATDYNAETEDCTAHGTCTQMYSDLVAQFIAASNRYYNDVQMMQPLSTSLANTSADIATSLGTLAGSCSSSSPVVDCGFDYELVGGAATARTANIEDVYSDCCGNTVGGGTTLPGQFNSALYPLQLEVVACANVKSLFPSALTWVQSPTFTAIGRAGATNIMATQEFFELGAIDNPVTGNPFQPAEFPENNDNGPVNPADNDPYLRIDYGGNNVNKPYGNTGNPATVTNPAGGAYVGVIANQAVNVYTGWWTAIAEPPYNGSISVPSKCAT
jgi:Flp pilus assembly protein TadG